MTDAARRVDHRLHRHQHALHVRVLNNGRHLRTAFRASALALFPREAIERALGAPLATAAGGSGKPNAPGQLESHYAPRAELRLSATHVGADEAALDFAGALAGRPTKAYLDLSPSGDLVEAAANFFTYLRVLDSSGAGRIAVAPVPGHRLGAAINDRLSRAAAPRSAPG